MEKIAEQFTQLKELLIEYFDSNVEYYKFTGFEKLMRLVVAITFVGVVFVLIALAMLFSGIGVAIWLGDLLENEIAGYLCIGLFYLLLLFLVYLLKKPLIERPLIKFFHQFLFKDEIKKENQN
ncbi:hypothetical protein [Labilibaculum antarcticum]|uniref:Competence protein n=1 Tax=Labilibaculum antarcticum TaxID=1717717 RepID=A0A1Y1CFR7_9BACT|nr:hypothetical protein [Labilibaculum antarcticum]BAX79130.1 hypothetical protein ALGA_0741 [Labilibaculum antarcticum]